MTEGAIWLIVVAVMIVIEIATLGLTTIWFAGGALISAIAAMLGASLPIQCVLFVVVSIVFILGMRPFAKRYLDKSRTKTNIDEIPGQVVKVTKRIDNYNEQGEVILKGMEWMAREANNQIVEVGEMVTVREVSGVKLIVEKQTEKL